MRKGPIILLVLVAPLMAACGADAREPGPDAGARSAPAGEGHNRQGVARAAARARLVQVGRFDAPLHVTAPRTDRRRLFVTEQRGRIMVMQGGRKLARPFLDIRSRVLYGGEQGLLGLAFAPDYARSGRFYIYYTTRNDTNEVWEFRRGSATRARLGSGRRVLAMPNLEPNHNGGNLVFGPDGLLYVGTGDGGGANDRHGTRGNAQDLGSLLGKLLRIDPRPRGGRPYRIPADNPFVGRAGRDEIYAYGLRNPWRFAFDRPTGALTIGDVGQNAVEEINFAARGAARGANYGWRPFEGNDRIYDEPAPGAVAPAITHRRKGEGFCSITGGLVVRDRAVPALYGRYLYADLCKDRLWGARFIGGRATDVGPLDIGRVSSVVSFGEDARGRVYVVSLEGPVWRLAAR